MLILSFGLLALALSPSGLLAAGIGEQCSSDSNCPFGSPCLQSIANKYCSAAGMLCGWSGTSGYQLNQKETSQQGKAYVCTIGGFKLDLGEKCSNSETCASGACVTAISNKYCSNFGATCGWPSTSGQMLGTEKQYDGKTYVCTPSGFELAAGSPTQAAIDQIFAAVSSFTHAVMSQLDTMKSQAQQAASQTAEYWGSCPSQSAQTKYEQVKSNRGDVNAAHQDAVAMRNQALAARTNCKSTFSNSPLCDATYNDLALHGAITALESARSVLDQALNAMKSLQCVSGCSQTATLQVPVPTIQDQGEWSLTAPGWVRGEVCTGFDLGSFDINTSAFATGNLSQLFQTQAPGCTRTERFALCTDWDLEALLETLQRRQRVSPEVDQITVDLPNRPLSVVSGVTTTQCQTPLEVCVPGGTVSVNEGGQLFSGAFGNCSSVETLGCQQPPFGLAATTTRLQIPDVTRARVRWGGRTAPGSIEIDLSGREFADACRGRGGSSLQIPRPPQVGLQVQNRAATYLCTQASMTKVVANI